MKQQNNNRFAEKVASQLDHDLQQLDDDINQRLATARLKAVAEAGTQPGRWHASTIFRPAYAPAFSLAVLFAITVGLYTVIEASREEEIPLFSASYTAEADNAIRDYELLTDLEFIYWLVEEENDAS